MGLGRLASSPSYLTPELLLVDRKAERRKVDDGGRAARVRARVVVAAVLESTGEALGF